MRVSHLIFTAVACFIPGVMGGASSESDSVPSPPTESGPPGPPGPPGNPAPAPAPLQCPECAGAQAIHCAAPGFCFCANSLAYGDQKTCSYDACCEPVKTCCEELEAVGYTCARNKVPTCKKYGGGYEKPVCKRSCSSYDDKYDYLKKLTALPESGFTFSNLELCCPDHTYDDSGRRSLNEVADLVLTEEELLAHESMAMCHGEDFDTYLFIDNTHFSAIASPGEKAQAAGCPFLLVTSDFGPDRPANKKAWAWFDKEQGESHFPAEKKLYIGSFKGEKLATAFEAAHPAYHGSYDFLTNNCAEFMINLADELGVEINSDIVGFATRRLLADKSSGLIKKMTESANYFTFFGDRRLRGENIVEDDLVGFLVKKKAGAL